MKSAGQLAYEADLRARPRYHDGKPRKSLSAAVTANWHGVCPSPVALVLKPITDGPNTGGTAIYHRDRHYQLYGCRTVNSTPKQRHDTIVSAWTTHARETGLLIEDERGEAG